MSECIGTYYIENELIKNSVDFDYQRFVPGILLYEVIRVIHTNPVFLNDHIERLFESARLSNKSLWLEHQAIANKIHQLIKINNELDGNIKFVFHFDENNQKTFAAWFTHHKYPTDEEYSNGVAVATLNTIRENPNAKIFNFGLRDTAEEMLQKLGVYEVILINEEGFITEGSRSNLFTIKDDTVFTTPGELVLYGVTRKYVMKVCEQSGLKVEERKMTLDEFKKTDAAFITSTSTKVLPISRIDDKVFTTENIHLRRIMIEYDRIFK